MGVTPRLVLTITLAWSMVNLTMVVVLLSVARTKPMGRRNEKLDPDLLASDPDINEPVLGVAVSVFCTKRHTYIELWQTGPDMAPGGTRVQFKRYRRHGEVPPDMAQIAGWLAREVSAADRGGWEGLRL